MDIDKRINNNKDEQDETQVQLQGIDPTLIYALYKRALAENEKKIRESDDAEDVDINTLGLIFFAKRNNAHGDLKSTFDMTLNSFGFEDDILSVLTLIVINTITNGVDSKEEMSENIKNYLKFFISEAKRELFKKKDFEDEYDEE